jgi:uncharacterized protein YbjT (DUF2867 family)
MNEQEQPHMATPLINSRKGTVLVTGGTGTLGTLVVSRLRDAGSKVRVLSRGRHPRDPLPGVEYVNADLSTGGALAAALDGIETVVHLAGSATGDAEKARHLVQAASRAGVRHLVYLSVVGDDRVPVTSRMDRAMFGYFAEKRAAGQLIRESGIGWTILHVTQVHQTMLATIQGMARLPVIQVPAGVRFQPIDGQEVADHLAQLVLGAPAGQVPDMGGPRAYEFADLVRGYLTATRRHRLVVRIPMVGGAARAVRDGATLAPDHAVGRRTWEDFLSSETDPDMVRRSVAA